VTEVREAREARLLAIFHRVAELPALERPAAIAAECGGDEALREELVRMFADDEAASELLDGGAGPIAQVVLNDADGALPPSGLFGPYRVLGRLDTEGNVFEAERTGVGGRVAIKVLRDAWVSPRRRQRFIDEQRTLARFNHDAIVRLFDTGTLKDGTPYFVMELVEGLPVTDYCARASSPLAARLQLFREVCAAVQHTHEKAMIHRDLKPANIYVSEDGAIKLLDFGIAKDLEPRTLPVEKTQSTWLMTWQYSAPEQRRGELLGTYTDVYLLGLILYELLTGTRPFPDREKTPPHAAEDLELDGEPEPPSVRARRVPPAGVSAAASAWAELDDMCLQAMHPDPLRRYPTVEKLIADIDHFQRGEPLSARPDSVRYRLRKFVTRHARPLAAAATVFVVIAGLIGFYTVRLARARDASLAAAKRTETVQHFTMSLFDAGDPDAAPASSLRVLTLLERGVQEAGALREAPETQAALYHTLGSVYLQLGDLERAGDLLERALALRRGLDPNHADVAETLIALGLLRLEDNHHADARRLVEDGLAMARGVVPDSHPLVPTGLSALGKVHRELNDYAAARVALDEAVRLLRRDAPGSAALSRALTPLANVHFYAGRMDDSERLNKEALAIDERLRGRQHPNVAHSLLNLAAIQSSRGRHVEAERFDREAVAILTAWYGGEHPETASSMIILTQALVPQGKWDEASNLLRRAIATQTRVYGPDHSRVAFGLNERGLLALRRKDLTEARESFERSLAILRKVYPNGRHFRIAVGMANLGSVFLEQRDYAAAEPLLQQAVALAGETQGPDHLNTGIARAKLGRVLLGQRRFSEANTHLLAARAVLMKRAPASTWLKNVEADLADVEAATVSATK
jgi:eukaryotic-like serine/threonine-protein kinase